MRVRCSIFCPENCQLTIWLVKIMSLGYIGYCKKACEDENAVVYAYSGADWNSPNCDRAAEKAYDGELYVSKSVLGWTRTKSKQQTEFIDWTYKAIEEGDAGVLRPCKNAFLRNNSYKIDYIAHLLLHNIFKRIYHEGVFPENEAFIQ